MKSVATLGLAGCMVALAAFAACSADDGASVSETHDAEAPDGATGSSPDGATAPSDAASPKDDGATAPSDGGPGADADADAATDAADANDGAPPAVNDCTVFEDHTGDATFTITWDFGIANASYRCLVVKAGTSVTFSGALASHPLKPQGGDVPTPIASTNMGSSVTFTFPDVGTYGYVCGFHAFMNGAIKVVP